MEIQHIQIISHIIYLQMKQANYKSFFKQYIYRISQCMCLVISRQKPARVLYNFQIILSVLGFHQTPPWKIPPPRKIPTQKIPTCNIPAHFTNGPGRGDERGLLTGENSACTIITNTELSI